MVEHVLAKDETRVRFSVPAHRQKFHMKHSNQHNFIGKIPDYVLFVTDKLNKAGFEAFVVGGCVRDLIIGKDPKDWDVTTNATPEQIISLFEKTIYENTFGTVGVCIPKVNVARETSTRVSGKAVSYETATSDDKIEYNIVEVTPYRTETIYSDGRHPDSVAFSDNIHDDLKRRDFTVNSMAYSPVKDILIDDYNGQKDISDKAIRTVGEADERFAEDALRMLRAVRFSCQLGFTISHETIEGVIHNQELLQKISAERIRDEFVKIIMSPDPTLGVGMLVKLGLNKYIVPELEEGVGCVQGGEHIYDVFEHMLQALGHAANKNLPLAIRLAALFHDIGKPRTKRAGVRKPTFYGHEVVGARMVAKIMERLKFPKDISEMVTKLVRYHMFFSDTEQITLSAVRRTIVNVGRENIWDLMEVRECDRVGMKKKEAPYRLRKYHAMIEEALRAPTSVGMLKINGGVLIKELEIKPGPRMGWILHALLEECLEDDTKNNSDYLKSQALELNKLSDKDLRELGEKGKEKKEETEQEELQKIHKKHGL